jgi:hypothetical protein
VSARRESEKEATDLELVSFSRDELLEDTVLVAQAVSPQRKLLEEFCQLSLSLRSLRTYGRRARVEVACSQTSKATVTETSVTFLLENVFHAEAEL